MPYLLVRSHICWEMKVFGGLNCDTGSELLETFIKSFCSVCAGVLLGVL